MGFGGARKSNYDGLFWGQGKKAEKPKGHTPQIFIIVGKCNS